jgi:hypothetical protein
MAANRAFYLLERLRGEPPTLDPADLRRPRWVRLYARRLFLSTDAVLFVGAGIAVGFLSDYFTQVESDGEAILIAFTAIGFAALAVALTALAIFVSLVNDAYLRILGMSERGGMAGYVMPYLTAALVSSVTTLFGAIGSIAYAAISPHGAKAVVLGIEVGLIAWTTWAVFQVVVEVAIHGLNRYNVAQAVERAKMPDISQILKEAATDG